MPGALFPITEVTVFPSRAQVLRRGDIELAAGIHNLAVDDLPASLVAESVRASARATAPARLHSTDVRTVHLDETTNSEVLAIKAELEQLDVDDQARVRRRGVVAVRRDFLSTLASGGGNQLARAVARGLTEVSTGTAITAFIKENGEDLDREEATLDSEGRAARKRRDALEASLAGLREVASTVRRQVAVTVEMSAPGTLALELRYQVTAAAWRPAYDLRVSTTSDGGDAVQLTYFGEVEQRSGEPWDAVQLRLSTAHTTGGTAVPELKPWELRIMYPQTQTQPMARASVAGMAASPPDPSAVAAVAAPLALGALVAEPVVASVDSDGPSITFRIDGSADVPSDGSPHKVTISDVSLPCQMDYVTAPKLAEEVYRRVKVTNDSPATLLPGRGQVFAEDEFVGASQLELTVPRGELELSLGVDDRITVERTMVSGMVDKKFMQDRRVITYAFRIEVTNLTGRNQKVTVRDQLPLSMHDQVKVRDAQFRPAPSKQDAMGLLEWLLDVKDGAKAEISLRYTIDHPRDLVLLNLPPVTA